MKLQDYLKNNNRGLYWRCHLRIHKRNVIEFDNDHLLFIGDITKYLEEKFKDLTLKDSEELYKIATLNLESKKCDPYTWFYWNGECCEEQEHLIELIDLEVWELIPNYLWEIARQYIEARYHCVIDTVYKLDNSINYTDLTDFYKTRIPTDIDIEDFKNNPKYDRWEYEEFDEYLDSLKDYLHDLIKEKTRERKYGK